MKHVWIVSNYRRISAVCLTRAAAYRAADKDARASATEHARINGGRRIFSWKALRKYYQVKKWLVYSENKT